MRYPIISRVLAVLLLSAAGLKAMGFAVEPISQMGVFSIAAFQFLVVAFELALGLWLISGMLASGAWLTVSAAFVGFAAVSFYQGIIGQASCGCFGKLSVNPWYIFAVDVVAVGVLAFSRPDLAPLWQNRRRIVLTTTYCCAAYVVLLGIFGVGVYLQFGSISGALATLRGERLSFSPLLIDMGEGSPGENRDASVELTNRTDQPIRLIGGTSDCSCTVLGDLPITIPPRESRSITITVGLPDAPGSFDRKAQLTVDDQGFKRIGFRLTGRITKAPE